MKATQQNHQDFWELVEIIGDYIDLILNNTIYMVISDEHLEEYRAIHKNYYGEEVSKERAYDQAIKLLTLLEIIYKPITVEDFDKMQEERKEAWLAHQNDGDPLHEWIEGYTQSVGHSVCDPVDQIKP